MRVLHTGFLRGYRARIAQSAFLRVYRAKTAQSAESSADITAAARDADRNPTDSQKNSNNYRKGHIRYRGFDISIENAKGSKRRGTDPSGKAWEVVMPAHYGYIRGTEGADGDHLDVYIGTAFKSPVAFIIDQLDADTHEFDEHKVMLCYSDEDAAKSTYLAGFSDGKGKARLGAITTVSLDAFKAWSRTRSVRKPFAWHPDTKK